VAALYSVVLILWLNFAYIDHQYDLSSEHNHDCQLYATGLHGALSTPWQLAFRATLDYAEKTLNYPFTIVFASVYLARSPPEFL
jgi:hypothetical protein